MYLGDFAAAETQAKAAVEINPQTVKAYLALAMAALVRGDAKSAQDYYEQARQTGTRGASLANIGLADVAMFQGRYRDAEPLLLAGIADDEAAKNTSGAALKYAALADVYLAEQKSSAAQNAAQQALKLSRSYAVLVPAARILTAVGKEADARALAAELDAQLQPLHSAYGKLIAGEIALQRGRLSEAVDAFLASQQFVDFSARGGNKGYWLARYDLGVAYVKASITPRRCRSSKRAEAAGRSHGRLHGRCADLPLRRRAAVLAGTRRKACNRKRLRSTTTRNSSSCAPPPRAIRSRWTPKRACPLSNPANGRRCERICRLPGAPPRSELPASCAIPAEFR